MIDEDDGLFDLVVAVVFDILALLQKLLVRLLLYTLVPVVKIIKLLFRFDIISNNDFDLCNVVLVLVLVLVLIILPCLKSASQQLNQVRVR